MTTPYQWVVKFWMPLSLSHLSFSLSNVLSRSFSILSAMHYPNEMGIYCVTGTNIHISVQWSTIGRWHPWAVPLYSIQCLSRSKLPILMQINLAWKECVAPSLLSVTCFPLSFQFSLSGWMLPFTGTTFEPCTANQLLFSLSLYAFLLNRSSTWTLIVSLLHSNWKLARKIDDDIKLPHYQNNQNGEHKPNQNPFKWRVIVTVFFFWLWNLQVQWANRVLGDAAIKRHSKQYWIGLLKRIHFIYMHVAVRVCIIYLCFLDKSLSSSSSCDAAEAAYIEWHQNNWLL